MHTNTCHCSCPKGSAETQVKNIKQMLEENTKELTDTKLILHHIDATNERIKASIEQQRSWLESIKNIEGLLAKLNLFIDAQGAVVQEAFNNITLKSGLHAERVSKELGGLVRLQISTQQQINGLEQKLDSHQKHVLQSARSIDNNILELTKLITRAVLPQLNGLQCSFDSLETSQINIEVELKSLTRVKDISEDSKRKLKVLGDQLVSLNRTQNARLAVLTHALTHLKPLNTWQIEHALRELIISQKRIELDLEACERRASPHSASYSAYEIKSHAPPPPRAQSSKQWDLEHVWNAEEQNQQNAHGSPSHLVAPTARKPAGSSFVSWQQPLPWEAVSPYQSAPAPKPKPNPLAWPTEPHYLSAPAPAPKPYQTGSGHRRPTANQKPCAQDQRPHSPPRHSAPASYGPPAAPAESYSQQGNKPGRATPQQSHAPWYSAHSPSNGY
ncbi:uncharacterized protein [Drosophila virilis]|uniref:Uncharacterized protein, isoform B n=1 Tax=Drosophila virilis TaxID=7244 RepID=A0A0Q9W9X4_DROVI|nr:vacuolar protein sorting-associated protein 37C isoform X2 [Drosophila virilis]KRF77807.1 uncharacterized protein Dvir_GJ18134, isoform B [Drosophila virilis]